MALANYVKFRRGTPAQFEALANKDADCLYFISEKNATQGVLYLGEKLISGSLTANTSLGDLQDILLSQSISPNSLLIYDGTQQKWVNKPFSEIIGDITGGLVEMVGATASQDGASGTVPQPRAGDDTKFLRGDATWVTISQLTEVQAQELVQLRTDVNGILGDDSGLSMREVAAQEVATVVANAPESFDTLKEIADWIADHPDSFTEINSRLTTLEGTTSVLQTTVYNLDDEIMALKAKDRNLEGQIADLDARLRWMAIDGSEEEEE